MQFAWDLALDPKFRFSYTGERRLEAITRKVNEHFHGGMHARKVRDVNSMLNRYRELFPQEAEREDQLQNKLSPTSWKIKNENGVTEEDTLTELFYDPEYRREDGKLNLPKIVAELNRVWHNGEERRTESKVSPKLRLMRDRNLDSRTTRRSYYSGGGGGDPLS